MNWGNCDYKQLLKLKENIDRLQSMDMQKFCRDASKELAARLLSLVIPATPVGQYPNPAEKVGYPGNIFSPCRSMNWKRLLQRCLRNG